jgi:hypothetical protein
MILINLIRDHPRRPGGREWFSSFGNEAVVAIHTELRLLFLKVSSLYRYGAEGGRYRAVMRWRLSR